MCLDVMSEYIVRLEIYGNSTLLQLVSKVPEQAPDSTLYGPFPSLLPRELRPLSQFSTILRR